MEALKNGISNYGLDANPIAVFASKVKTYTGYEPALLREYLGFIHCSIKLSYKHHGILEPQEELFGYETKLSPVKVEGVADLPGEQKRVIPSGFICAKPLLKVLIIKQIILSIEHKAVRDFFLLALASFIVRGAGNVRFGPEVGRTKPKGDVESVRGFTEIAESMINDVERTKLSGQAQILAGDAREIERYLPQELSGGINCVISSPPYPNEKDYTRSTRLESVLLDFIKDRQGLRKIKNNLLRSNSRNVFVSDKDAEYVRHFSRITSIAEEIESKRLDLNNKAFSSREMPISLRGW
ncbi:MAG: hypothetical protein ACYTEL_25675 [Planctomycetota bacterium]